MSKVLDSLQSRKPPHAPADLDILATTKRQTPPSQETFVCPKLLSRSLTIPTLAKRIFRGYISTRTSGSNSAVECQLPKLDVAGSIPVSRSLRATTPAFRNSVYPNVPYWLLIDRMGFEGFDSLDLPIHRCLREIIFGMSSGRKVAHLDADVLDAVFPPPPFYRKEESGRISSVVCFQPRRSGGIGRRTRLKIWRGATLVGVQVPPPALIQQHLSPTVQERLFATSQPQRRARVRTRPHGVAQLHLR